MAAPTVTAPGSTGAIQYTPVSVTFAYNAIATSIPTGKNPVLSYTGNLPSNVSAAAQTIVGGTAVVVALSGTPPTPGRFISYWTCVNDDGTSATNTLTIVVQGEVDQLLADGISQAITARPTVVTLVNRTTTHNSATGSPTTTESTLEISGFLSQWVEDKGKRRYRTLTFALADLGAFEIRDSTAVRIEGKTCENVKARRAGTSAFITLEITES